MAPWRPEASKADMQKAEVSQQNCLEGNYLWQEVNKTPYMDIGDKNVSVFVGNKWEHFCILVMSFECLFAEKY